MTASRTPVLVLLPVAGERVGGGQEQAEDDEHEGDQPDLAEVIVDRALQQGADDGAGDGGEQEEPGQALVRRADGPVPDRRQPGTGQAAQIPAEVDHGGDEGAGVEGDVEGLVQVDVGRAVELLPAEQPWHQDQVPARGDGQELRQSLGDAQDDGVEDGNVACGGLGDEGAEHPREVTSAESRQ